MNVNAAKSAGWAAATKLMGPEQLAHEANKVHRVIIAGIDAGKNPAAPPASCGGLVGEPGFHQVYEAAKAAASE